MTRPRTWREAIRDPRVEGSSDERGPGNDPGDGLWLYLHRPWVCPDTGTSSVHEWSVAAAIDSLRHCERDEQWWLENDGPA